MRLLSIPPSCDMAEIQKGGKIYNTPIFSFRKHNLIWKKARYFSEDSPLFELRQDLQYPNIFQVTEPYLQEGKL